MTRLHAATTTISHQNGMVLVLTGAATAPPLDWKSSIWQPVWLIGMGIISWLGQYSGGAVAAPVNTNTIPFWWDMIVVAAFSLVIFYWAMATKLPREEMMNLVNRQASENPEDDLPPAPRH